jgi:hypothetical protein
VFETPVTMMEVRASLALRELPPLSDEHVTVYRVIVEPPFLGGLKDTDMRESPATANGREGLLGTVLGITGADCSDAGPMPNPLIARTEHRYVWPFVTPLTTIGEEMPFAARAVPPFVDKQAAV